MKKNMKQFVNSLPYINQKERIKKKKPQIGEIIYSEETACFQL